MNLDRWLIRVPPRPDPEGMCAVGMPPSSPLMPLDMNVPAPKRVKLAAPKATPDAPAPKHLRHLPSPALASRLRYQKSYFPLEMYHYYEARKVRQTQELSLTQVPFVVASLYQKPRALLGLQNGKLAVFDTQISSEGLLVGEHEIFTGSAVRDASVARGDATTLCGSDLSVKECDLETGQIGHEYVPDDDVGFRQVAYSPQRDVFATGTHSGNVYIMDSRQPQPTRRILNAHRVDKRTTAQISGLVWLDDTTLATAGSSNDVVKLWDMRHSRKCLHQTAPQKRTGISSMTVDDSGRVWSLRKSGELFSTSLAGPDTELHSKYLKPRSSYSRVEFVKSPNVLGSYLACSGEEGVTLFTCPSRQAVQSGFDLSSTAVLLRGHRRECTSISWHSGSDCLLSVGDDYSLRYWRFNECPQL